MVLRWFFFYSKIRFGQFDSPSVCQGNRIDVTQQLVRRNFSFSIGNFFFNFLYLTVIYAHDTKSCCSVCIQRETRILTKLMTVLLNIQFHSTHRAHSTQNIRSTNWSVLESEWARRRNGTHRWASRDAMCRLVGMRSTLCIVYLYVRLCIYSAMVKIYVLNDYHRGFFSVWRRQS